MPLIRFKAEGRHFFEIFANNRAMLIDMLEQRKLDKKEFLIQNVELMKRFSMTPYSSISSFEEGIFNYQYYNVLAKYCAMQLSELPRGKRGLRRERELNNKIDNYYREKDRATLLLLEWANYEAVEAYYIAMNSKSLDGVLYEIHFSRFNKAILHSKSSEIKKRLEEHRAFSEEKRISKIADYINSTY